jgi:hypothetical protein
VIKTVCVGKPLIDTANADNEENEMFLTTKFRPLSVATSLAVAAIGAPLMLGASAAQADVSATISASNMYLWRGQNISNPSPEVAGSLDYSTGGFYAGIWASSEGSFDDSYETDLYAGYGTSIGDFGIDLSYWDYLYPSATGSLEDTNFQDVVLGLSYGPVGFTVYQGIDSDTTKDTYYTLSGDIGSFTLLYGYYQGQNEADGADYQHLQLSYAFNDELSFTVSKASDDGYGVEEDPLFQVTWSKTWDLK